MPSINQISIGLLSSNEIEHATTFERANGILYCLSISRFMVNSMAPGIAGLSPAQALVRDTGSVPAIVGLPSGCRAARRQSRTAGYLGKVECHGPLLEALGWPVASGFRGAAAGT